MTTCSTRCARWLTRFAGQAVTFTYLFGSHARGTARPNSDVDIAVHLDEAVPPAAHLDLGRGLAGELAYRSGVGPIDGVVVFNEARLGLVGRVLADRRVIYSADERVVEILHSRLDDFDQFRAAMARTVGGP